MFISKREFESLKSTVKELEEQIFNTTYTYSFSFSGEEYPTLKSDIRAIKQHLGIYTEVSKSDVVVKKVSKK